MKDPEMTNDVVVHLSPVWRDKANFTIFGKIECGEVLPKQWEQLWAKQMSEDQFEICCIPFFIYGLALGDQVKTKARGGKKYVINKVTERSGSRTVRVDFRKEVNPVIKEEVINKVTTMGCLPEWYSENFLAVDLSSDQQFRDLEAFLTDYEERTMLKYEIGY